MDCHSSSAGTTIPFRYPGDTEVTSRAPVNLRRGSAHPKDLTMVGPELQFDILQQPDDSTCGPTCLQAVYGFYGDELPLDRVIREVQPLPSGGTLGVLLGIHARKRGYRVRIYTYNLLTFDPSWFVNGRGRDLAARLRQQADVKTDPKLRFATEAYLEFLALGGEIRYAELSPSLLRRHLRRGEPILTGLSATYLYACAREIEEGGRMRFEDIRGAPQGHFVVLHGYDKARRVVRVADPLYDNPAFRASSYEAKLHRVMMAIGLGALTFDANLVIITNGDSRTA
jgi:hypothetical protein